MLSSTNRLKCLKKTDSALKVKFVLSSVLACHALAEISISLNQLPIRGYMPWFDEIT